MSELVIKPVETRKERKQFLQLPWKIYRDDDMWIPALRVSEKEMVGFSKHPFHEFATVQPFIALRDGEAVGRICAIVNPRHVKFQKEEIGFFGFFESINDLAVSSGLFDAARDFLSSHGLEKMRGPLNPSLNYECGLLVDGFHSPPTFMMTYNRPYYVELFDAYGMETNQELVAFKFPVDGVPDLDPKVFKVVEMGKERFDIKLRKINVKDFNNECRMFLDVYNRAMGGTWGFVPFTESEIKHLAKSLKLLIAEEMTSVAMVDGEPIAALFGLLDYNPIIKQIKGRLLPFGIFKLLMGKRKIKKMRVMSANVIPEYQKWGVGIIALSRFEEEYGPWGLEDLEFSWVLKSNHLSYKTLMRGGATPEKTWKIYDYQNK